MVVVHIQKKELHTAPLEEINSVSAENNQSRGSSGTTQASVAEATHSPLEVWVLGCHKGNQNFRGPLTVHFLLPLSL